MCVFIKKKGKVCVCVCVCMYIQGICVDLVPSAANVNILPNDKIKKNAFVIR